MLMPSIFGENLFDDFFGDFPFYYDDRAMKDAEKKLYGHKANHVMKTDIKEMNNGYELIVDLPGFKKDEVHAALENGYLTISAEKGLDKDEKEKETGRYIRRERYAVTIKPPISSCLMASSFPAYILLPTHITLLPVAIILEYKTIFLVLALYRLRETFMDGSYISICRVLIRRFIKSASFADVPTLNMSPELI